MTVTPNRTENHNSSLITSQASVESPARNWVSNRSPKDKTRDQAQHLKGTISLTRLLQADGHRIESSGSSKRCLCPFHGERTASFSIQEERGRAKCFGCGWSGDVINYVRDFHEMSFPEAVTYLSNQAYRLGRSKGVSLVKPKLLAPTQQCLTKTQQDRLKAAAQRLAGNPYIWSSVASKRGWNPATIKALADEGSLGWDGSALAFLYPTGMKSRNWPHKEIFWDFGNPSVWRGDQIGNAKEVFICEGETDCISLVDKGIEEDGTMAVIALPSASTIPAELAKLVQGKHVTLCMDDDDAGARATKKLAGQLLNVCASVKTFNFKGVAQ